jgi:hypothetical protein
LLVNIVGNLIDSVASGMSPADAIDECVLDEAKVKVSFEKGHEGSISKYPLTGRKADQYKSGNWNWVRGLVKKWKGSRKPRLVIKVGVWDLDGKPAHNTLGQEFTADDLAAAKKYARDLVASGQARMTDVEGRVIMPYEQDQVVHFGMYQPVE